jgi:hypothetical protein
MEKSLHFFDLDYTLWKMDEKLAVIDKSSPQTVIYRIDPFEISFMKDLYKSFDLKVEYNGNTWYLNDKIWDEINKNKKYDIKDIGISHREFTDEQCLEKQISTTEYFLSLLDHLKNKNIEIGFLTARYDKKNNKKNIEVLVDKIDRKLHTRVYKMYFVNDMDDNHNSDITAYRKAKIVLEYLIGYKIKGNKFVELKQEKFNNVSLYDDEIQNIEGVNNLQFLLETILLRTDVDIKRDILQRVKNNKLYYTTYLITQNKVNPFIINEQILLPPNHIKLFENFK